MIGGIERMICLHKREEKGEDDAEASTTTILNPAIKKHFELQIKTLQNAPRDTKRLEKLLIEKEKEWENS